MSARRTATKKNSTKRTGAKKGGTARKGKVTRINKHNNIMSNEILCVAALAGSALALISLLSNEENAAQGMGAAGNLIRQVLLGLFGMGGYLLPVSLIIFSIYMLFNRTTIISPAKAYGAVILFFTSLSGAHILSFDPAARFNDYADYILSNYRSGAIGNGGFFGALFGNVFYQILGKAGSLIFIGALWLICAMVVTGRSFFEDIAVFFVWIRNAFSGDESDEAEYEEYEEYEEEAVPPPRSVVRVKKPPEERASHINRKGKTGPKVYNLNDEKEDGSRLGEDAARKKNGGDKVLLFSEEFKKSQNPEDQIAHPVVTEIKVRGIYEEEADSMHNKLQQTEEPDFDEEPDERPEERQMQEIYINTAPILPVEMPEPVVPIASPPALPTSLVSATIGESADYVFPPIDFLNQNTNQGSASSKAQILENSRKLEETLKSFGVEARVVEVSKGPTVTRYELSPGPGVKVSRISGLADDLALNLAAVGIRIEAPIPGKSAVGIEVPNKEVLPVYLREVLEDDSFKRFPSNLAFALGKDIAGNPVVADIAKMPHLLIAGATGSGKSVCINTLITSIIYKAKPEEVKLLMVDPKVVELSVYNGIPHLLIPVVTDPKKAAGALNWAVREMLIRYDLFAQAAVRDLKGYNAHKAEAGEKDFLPQIVIIIDELADLMMAAPGEVEEAICRLAQMARAAGLHLIIATQRPSVDVITGLIKANVPSRLAFSVSSGTDSRTILDMVGAERLLGKGDMLFSPVGLGKPMRVQGAFISDKEVENIVSFVKRGTDQQYDQEMIDNITSAGSTGEIGGDVDEFFEEAVMFIIGKEKASASMLQRQFRIGYNRASRLIEDLEARGIVGPEDGSKPRKVLMTTMQWRAYKEGKDGS